MEKKKIGVGVGCWIEQIDEIDEIDEIDGIEIGIGVGIGIDGARGSAGILPVKNVHIPASECPPFPYLLFPLTVTVVLSNNGLWEITPKGRAWRQS